MAKIELAESRARSKGRRGNVVDSDIDRNFFLFFFFFDFQRRRGKELRRGEGGFVEFCNLFRGVRYSISSKF